MMDGKALIELIHLILDAIVDNMQDVIVECVSDKYGLIIGIDAPPEQRGKIIGKHGETIDAIRVLAQCTQQRYRKAIIVVKD